MRIDKLDPDFVKGNDGDHWRDVMDRLEFGDMPPEKAPALRKEDRELMTAWIAQGHRQAELAKTQATTFRRLTRREYERTMQDLLGLPIEFGTRLPEDGRSKDGFRNDGDALRMSPLQYETYLQIADEALTEAIVTGPPPVVHRYRITVDKFRVEALPKPADRPGESFDYAGHPFDITNIGPIPQRPPGGGNRASRPPTRTRPTSCRPRRSCVSARRPCRLPRNSVALRLHQAFRKGETRIKVRAARVEPEEGADASRVPILTVAIGSTNFHGVELKTVGEPIVIDHTDFRTYEIPGSHGERLGPEHGAAERQELDHPGGVELGEGDRGRVTAAAAEDRVDRVRESVFRNPGRPGRTPTSCSPTTGLTRRRMPAKSCAASPRGPIAARSPRPSSIGSSITGRSHAKTPIPWKSACEKRSASS